VAACTDLRRVTIEGCGALKELRFQSRSLESLSVAHAEALRTVELRCPQLSELSVHTAPLVPRAGGDAKPAPREHEHALARQIAECCPRLARLHFAVPGLADRGLAALLSNTPQGLKALCVTGAVNLTDQAVEAMVGCCPKLELVDLSGCASLTDAALETLAAAYGGRLTHLLMACCPRLTCVGMTNATAQMGGLQLLDVGMSLRQASSAMQQAQQTPRRVPLKRKAPALEVAPKRSRRGGGSCASSDPAEVAGGEAGMALHLPCLQRLSLWGCDGLAGLNLECPSLLDLNLNQCTALEGINMSAKCPSLVALSAAECSQSVLDALSRQCRVLPDTTSL